MVFSSQSKPLLAGILIPLLQESPSIVITSIKAELDDIREGPSKADFFLAIEIFPDLFKTFLVKEDNPLTAGKNTL